MGRLGITISLTKSSTGKWSSREINKEIRRLLRSYRANDDGDRSKYIPWVEYAQNSLHHSANNLTLFQRALGFQPPLFPRNANITDIPAVDDWILRSKPIWADSHQWLENIPETGKWFPDRPLDNNGGYLATRRTKLDSSQSQSRPTHHPRFLLSLHRPSRTPQKSVFSSQSELFMDGSGICSTFEW